MARYVFKKKNRIVRKFGPVSGLSPHVERTSRPGVHGSKRTGKQSEFSKGLFNKNKLRACFGINDRQFRKYFAQAVKAPDTGEALLQLLELRLDNLVYRLGLAPSLPAARQLVVHGHIEVELVKQSAQSSNQEDEAKYQRVDKPGYTLKIGQKVRFSRKFVKKLPAVIEQCIGRAERVEYVEFDSVKQGGYFSRMPSAEEIPVPVEVSKIIEFSSTRI